MSLYNYKDISIFKGWKQWKDSTDGEWRAEYKGSKLWAIYKLCKDAFQYRLTISAPKNASCNKLAEIFDEQCE